LSRLGILQFNNPIPQYWNDIQNYPDQIKLFALVAAIFTHHENMDLFAHKYNKGEMQGLFVMEPGKHFTNLRSALVVSGAAEKIYRRRTEVPYDFSKLYEVGAVGLLTRELLKERLLRIGYTIDDVANNFENISIGLDFHLALSLTEDQYRKWVAGEGLSTSLAELTRNNITYERFNKIRALRVNQWLNEWDEVPRYNEKNRKKPKPHFYLFNIPALLLKRIYDVHARKAYVTRTDEPYSQRKHSEIRSTEIREFVKGGFPWSTLSDQERQADAYKNLRMPGWLPTSIIANLLNDNSIRKDKQINQDEVIRIEDNEDGTANLLLPKKIWSNEWLPQLSPIEIIDGQHRIKAFDRIKKIEGHYDLPVVAFHDLDFTWQAYLFYTINIKPKKINTSLAYDLMPLLRIQEWLDQDANGPDIYKKVRAQELTEILWKQPSSPWFERINMLGDYGDVKAGPVSQNAFINSLTATFVKKWEGKIGGLFGGELHEGEQDVIQWDKETQGAFLTFIWDKIHKEVKLSKASWIMNLRSRESASSIDHESKLDVAFTSKLSFFTTDQGVRAIFYVFNDMCFVANENLNLQKFFVDIDYESYTNDVIIDLIIEAFRVDDLINEFIREIAKELVNEFEWRTSSAFDANNPQEDIIRQNQNQFKGSSGYREFRRQLMRILVKSERVITKDGRTITISEVAKEVIEKLGL